MRGTTRDARRTAAIEAAGAEAWEADPDRLATMTRALDGVTIACWLLASASGPPERVRALHDERLGAFLAEIVDTPVRGFVYEAAGTVGDEALARGREVVERAHRTWRIPMAVVDVAPSDRAAWLAAAARAVGGLLEPRRPG